MVLVLWKQKAGTQLHKNPIIVHSDYIKTKGPAIGALVGPKLPVSGQTDDTVHVATSG
jgi:hypothetical protein